MSATTASRDASLLPKSSSSLKQGMTKRQVEKAVGRPTTVTEFETEGPVVLPRSGWSGGPQARASELWWYRFSNGLLRVFFSEGVVTRVETASITAPQERAVAASSTPVAADRPSSPLPAKHCQQCNAPLPADARLFLCEACKRATLPSPSANSLAKAATLSPGVCPSCKKALRTAKAQQCFECGADWHSTGS